MISKRTTRLAIEALEYRRRNYASGHNACQNGFDVVWTKRDSKKYVELSEAIKELKEK